MADDTPKKRWSIRLYYTYVDEYVVTAETIEEAYEMVDDPKAHPDTVALVNENEYVDFDSACGNELAEDGSYIDDVTELAS
jgi:hypothetical protein